ncbi:hypothetical protein [uncultured Mediterranea sp.]|uniref:hypothetical protein n=1 Tax=uncultured Mediterranea sp. TaxID=1926662 RepID=UPI00259054FD|nr:hypothetical protein [uncultured Mediterranea sp.]
MDCFMAECFSFFTNLWRKEETCKVLVCFMFLVGMILPTFPFPVSGIVFLQNIAFSGAKHSFFLGKTLLSLGEKDGERGSPLPLPSLKVPFKLGKRSV